MKTTLTLGAMVMMTFGCGVEADNIGDTSRLGESSRDLGEQNPEFEDGSLSVTSPEMSGQIGAQSELDQGTMTVEGYREAAFASVDTRVALGTGAAMSIVQIFGGLDHADFYDEVPAQFSDTEFPQGGRGFAQVWGCSGPQDGDWEYDRNAESVTLQAQKLDDESIEFRYQARFTTWDESERSFVNGSFVLNTID